MVGLLLDRGVVLLLDDGERRSHALRCVRRCVALVHPPFEEAVRLAARSPRLVFGLLLRAVVVVAAVVAVAARAIVLAAIVDEVVRLVVVVPPPPPLPLHHERGVAGGMGQSRLLHGAIVRRLLLLLRLHGGEVHHVRSVDDF